MTANTYVAGPIERTERYDFRDALSAESGFQPLLERDVVIRRLSGEAAASPRARSRFTAEVKALASLSHHSFIRVYDAGVQGDVPFAVFERLRGITAQHRLDLLADRGGRMAVDEAVHIVRSVGEGMGHARRQGVRVHDVSPANIVLAEHRRAVLMSLGLPLPDSPLEASATALAYAAPERLFGAPCEEEGDVYSLGVLLAHLVFGRLPFEGTAVSVLAQKQQTESLPILEDGQTALGCPYSVAAVIHRATSAEPGERYGDVEELVAAMLDSVGGRAARAAAPARHEAHRGSREAGFAIHTAARQAYAEPLWREHVSEEELSPAQWAELRQSARHARTEPARQPEQRRQPLHLRAVDTGETFPLRAGEPAVLRATVPSEPIAEPPLAADASAEAAPPAAYDPLMPGLDNPALAAALPYTTLVPMPEGAEEPDPAHQGSVTLRQSFLSPSHVAILMVISALAISAALMFG